MAEFSKVSWELYQQFGGRKLTLAHQSYAYSVWPVNFVGSIIFIRAVVHLTEVYYSFNIIAVSYQCKSASFLTDMRKYMNLPY